MRVSPVTILAVFIIGFFAGYLVFNSTAPQPLTATKTVTTATTIRETSTTTIFSTQTTTITLSHRVGGKPVDLVATVYRIVDGDTFDAFPSGRVRLADINTPERNEPGYNEAKEALRRLVEGKKVFLDVDNVNVMDSYQRLVAVVYVQHNSTHVLNVNLWLVTNGYAAFRDFNNEFNPATWNLYTPFS
jgi:endonuclease YncB( thermonuclease family)